MKSHQFATAATITVLALGSTQTIFAEDTTETTRNLSKHKERSRSRVQMGHRSCAESRLRDA